MKQNPFMQNERDWTEIFNTLNDAVTVHDRKFNVLYANRAAEKLLELSSHDILNQKCFMSYHKSAKPPEWCPSCRTLKTGNFSETVIYEPHLNKYLDIKALPQFDKNKKISALVHIVKEVTERKLLKEGIEESDIAFRGLLKQHNKDIEETKESILNNVRYLILPYIMSLKKTGLKPKQLDYLNIIESKLKNILSSFSLLTGYFGLSAKEIKIADLIKEGRHDKEIMEILSISMETAKTHRQNIRKKLGIYGKRTNLREHLLSLIK